MVVITGFVGVVLIHVFEFFLKSLLFLWYWIMQFHFILFCILLEF